MSSIGRQTVIDIGVKYFAVVKSTGVVTLNSVTFHWKRRPISDLKYTLGVLHRLLDRITATRQTDHHNNITTHITIKC